jgi:hypothetical protein
MLSFVGFLLLGTVYFNQNNRNYHQKNDVVIQKTMQTKPTVDSDNDVNLKARIRRSRRNRI